MNLPSRPPAYGTTRHRRPTVSFAEFERAATSLLAAGAKPGLDNIRKAIGGSPETIRQMLRRYWSELAAQVRSPAESLMRLPSEIADLADEIWQRALGLAAQSASHDDNAARERLEQVKRENDLQSHALAMKERTLNEREEQRDKAMAELQEQVATLLSIVRRNTETIATLQIGKADAQTTAENYRQRLAHIIARAVLKNQKATTPTPPKNRAAPSPPRARRIPARPAKRPVNKKRKTTRRLP